MSSPVELLEECLNMATSVNSGLDGAININDEKLHWLERQLANIMVQLQAMLMDIESGLTTQDIGFFGENDFEDMVEDMKVSISQLREQIQTIRSRSR